MIAIKKDLTVDASQETAFRVFCQKMDLWWPRSHHSGNSPMVKMVLEPWEKGRWYSTHEDGTRCDIGYVQRFEPNARLVLVWQLNTEFQFDPDQQAEIEVNFTSQGAQTTVSLEHRNIETLGKAVGGIDQGWGLIIDLYKVFAKSGKLSGEALAIYQRQVVER